MKTVNMTEDFNLKSYELHKAEHQKHFNSEKLSSWKNKTTVDFWRHERMYSNISPLIDSYPDASWLTIGDGRYGTDANFILSQGCKDVLATDISDTYLRIALAEGFITNYKTENAESLSFDNSSFDFVLCKEAYHHFPRPMVALYEMIRVAKKGVILMEPQDPNLLVPSRLQLNSLLKWTGQTIKNALKTRMGKEIYYSYGNYEEVGNYIYTISEREIEKVALGLNLDLVSFKGLNDYYEEGVEFEEQDELSELFKRVKTNIAEKDKRTRKGLQQAGMLISIIFKTPPSKDCLTSLEQMGFKIRKLPKNPYIL